MPEEAVSKITRKLSSRLAADHERQSIDVIIISKNHEFAKAWSEEIASLLTLEEAADSICIVDAFAELEKLLLRRNDPMLVLDLDILGDFSIEEVHDTLDHLHVVSSINIVSPEYNEEGYVSFGERFIVDDYRWGAPNGINATTLVRAAREKIYLRNRLVAGEGVMNSDERLRKLNRIGLAFSREHDLTRLLNLVLRECRELLNADAGSIYILEAPGQGVRKRRLLGRARRQSAASAVRLTQKITNELKGWNLRFAAAQNDSVKIPFKDFSFPANMESIAGYCVLRSETLNIEDVYETGGSKTPYVFNKQIDIEYAYRCVSMLSVPMVNMRDELVGVIQLINKKRDPLQKLDDPSKTPERVTTFDDDDLELARMLGTQAGAAIDNVRLTDSINALFEGFVTATVRSIEQRDPSTAGHSARVDRLTLGIADEINRAESGPYADTCFTDEEMVELHYAALLHDVGKIGVREHVLTKANKLFPEQSEIIRTRAELIASSLHLIAAEKRCTLLGEKNGVVTQDSFDKIEADLERHLQRLAEDLTFVLEINKPGYLSPDKEQRLNNVFNREYPVADGVANKLINEEEYHALAIVKGSLSNEERLEMQSHVAKSRTFLEQIPWTPELANVPQIAGQHHEKMNAQGYPDGIPAAETPLQARIMAVADVFDSLTSADRPYKPAIPLERALQILEAMRDDGELDPEIVDLFMQQRMWEKLRLKVVRMEDATEAQRNAQ